MKNSLIALLLTAACASMAQMPEIDPSKIDVYITPYYNSEGPQISVGKYSEGLQSSDEKAFLKTIHAMKADWAKLTAEEMYVGAIRLYDLGYRDESAYWFYAAQMRSRIFGSVIDESKMGGIGSSGFELMQAQNSFYQLAGPFINGYAFGDIDKLIAVLVRVKKEGIPDLAAIYPNVTFISEGERMTEARDIVAGLDEFIAFLQDKEQRESIKQQRAEAGTDEQYSKLENKALPDA